MSIRCISQSFQNVLFVNHSVWPCRYGFFYLSLPVGDKLPGQLISGTTVNWLFGLR